ncbi:hypothetical protein ACFLS0_04525, partial [Candidatus Bipolaricaulota bacterium]
ARVRWSCYDVPMTLVLAVRGSDGVVMGADSRAVNNGMAIDGVHKIVQVARDCCVGVAETASAGVPFLRDAVQEMGLSIDRVADAHEVARGLEEVLNRRLDQAGDKEKRLLASAKFILAGYMGDGVRSVVYVLDAQLVGRFFILDQPEGFNKIGQDNLASYYLALLQQPSDGIPCGELARLVHFILAETSDTAPSVAMPFYLVRVGVDGVHRLDAAEYVTSSLGAGERIRAIVKVLAGSRN